MVERVDQILQDQEPSDRIQKAVKEEAVGEVPDEEETLLRFR